MAANDASFVADARRRNAFVHLGLAQVVVVAKMRTESRPRLEMRAMRAPACLSFMTTGIGPVSFAAALAGLVLRFRERLLPLR